MSLAPEHEIRALMAAARDAILAARSFAWAGSARATGSEKELFDNIAALMDAIHNMPDAVARWDSDRLRWVVPRFARYDERWNRGEPWLMKAYRDAGGAACDDGTIPQ